MLPDRLCGSRRAHVLGGLVDRGLTRPRDGLDEAGRTRWVTHRTIVPPFPSVTVSPALLAAGLLAAVAAGCGVPAPGARRTRTRPRLDERRGGPGAAPAGAGRAAARPDARSPRVSRSTTASSTRAPGWRAARSCASSTPTPVPSAVRAPARAALRRGHHGGGRPDLAADLARRRGARVGPGDAHAAPPGSDRGRGLGAVPGRHPAGPQRRHGPPALPRSRHLRRAGLGRRDARRRAGRPAQRAGVRRRAGLGERLADRPHRADRPRRPAGSRRSSTPRGCSTPDRRAGTDVLNGIAAVPGDRRVPRSPGSSGR